MSLNDARIKRNAWDLYKSRNGDPGAAKKMMKVLIGIGREFCLETGMHGFTHIAQPRRHWIERLFWMTLVSIAAWATFEVSKDQWTRYNENPTVVTLEKDFRSWEFCLPAVTACYLNRFDPVKLPDVIKKYWNISPDHESYSYFTRFVKVVTSSDILNLMKFDEFKNDERLTADLFQLAVEVMPEMNLKVQSSGKGEINWFPVMTEMGICYSTNTIALDDIAIKTINKNLTTSYPLKCKYISLLCYIMVEIPERFNNITVYYHSPYDIMNMALNGTELVGGSTFIKELSVMESVCGPGVRELSRRRRGCLYTDEPQGPNRKVFSAMMCRSTCRSRLAVQHCGCRPFYYFFDVIGPLCNHSGMACLAKYSHNLQHPFTSKCHCPPQCVSSIFQDLGTTKTKWFSSESTDIIKSRGSVKFVVQAPKIRYTRDIVFHFHDLVVSFGGAAGLFLGASVISFVEIMYFIIEKMFRLLFKNKKTHREVTKVMPYEQFNIIRLNKLLKEQEKYKNIINIKN